jgi:pimeloyl-ACP methyl ester carboxylesterase
MAQQGRWPGWLGRLFLMALCLGTGPGCLSFVHSLDLPPKDQLLSSETIPALCRNHVHIFLVHGMDPLDLANLSGLRDYVQSLGYIKTHYGQLYHLWEFKKELRRIHQEDPEARFVLIGFSFGANMARELANAVKDDNIWIDLLVYLGGNTLENTPSNRPDHVTHIVNILATGCIWNGTTLDGANNVHYDNVWHFGSPTHPQTLELLARELAIVAGRVPYVEKVPPSLLEEAPRPRPLRADQVRKMPPVPPEWDFLDSRSAYKEPLPPDLAQPARTSSVKRVPFALRP